MEYGFSTKCISPSVGTKMAGYVREQSALGINDDLYVASLVLKDGSGNIFLMVSADIIGFDKSDSAEMKAVFKGRFGISENSVLLNASHTHFGPATIKTFLPKWEKGEIGIYNDAYCQMMKHLIYESVADAVGNMSKCSISTGTLHSDFGVNRRTVENGKAISKPDPSSSIDDNFTIAVLKSPDGSPKVVLLNYGAHPTNMHRDYISADYPGMLRRYLKAEFSQSLEIMFFQGAAGDISVRKPEIYENGLAAVHAAVSKQGKEIAAAIRGTMTDINCNEIKAVSSNIRLPLDMDRNFNGATLNDENWLKRAWADNMNVMKKTDSVELECNCWKFDKKFSIVTLSGEICHEIALMARNAFKSEHLFFLGYTNGSPCYVPPDKIIGEGGYEGEDSMIVYSLQAPFKKGIDKELWKVFCILRDKLQNE